MNHIARALLTILVVIAIAETDARVPVSAEPTRVEYPTPDISQDPSPEYLGHFTTPFVPSAAPAIAKADLLFVTSQVTSNSDGGELYRSIDGGLTWELLPIATMSGSVITRAYSPDYENTPLILAGLDRSINALRRSEDGGLGWSDVSQAPDGPLTQIVFSHFFGFDQTVFGVQATYSQGRLWRSTDGGDHWSVLYDLPAVSPTHLLPSPYVAWDRTLYLRSVWPESLWASLNNGANWQRIDAVLGLGHGNYISSMCTVPLAGGESALFVATNWGLVVTFDSGKTWYLVTDLSLTDLGVTDGLYIFGIERNSQRLLRSTDLGQTWSELAPGNAFTSLAAAPDFTYSGLMYAQSTKLWRSQDGGASLQPLYSVQGSPFPSAYGGYMLQWAVSPDFVNDRTLVTHNTYGMDRSLDGGLNWNPFPLPVSAPNQSSLFAFSGSYAADKTVFLSIGTSLYKSTNWNSWVLVNASLPFMPVTIAASPYFQTDQTLFASSDHWGQQGLYRSQNGGLSWVSVTPTSPQYFAKADFVFSPSYQSDQTVFAASPSNGLYKSQNSGNSWVKLSTPTSLFGDIYLGLSPNYAQDQTLFVKDWNTEGLRSVDGGSTWARIGSCCLRPIDSRVVASLNFPNDQTVVIGAFTSEDAGLTWRKPRGITSNGVFAITEEAGRLTPFSHGLQAVYRFRWPALTNIPTQIAFPIVSGTSLPATVVFTPAFDDQSQPRSWEIQGNVPWLTVTPLTGTVFSPITVTVDPAQVTATTATELVLTVNWTSRYATTTRIPVTALIATNQVYLPLVSRQSAPRYVIDLTVSNSDTNGTLSQDNELPIDTTKLAACFNGLESKIPLCLEAEPILQFQDRLRSFTAP